MLYSVLTGSRALSVPSTPFTFGTTAVSTGKGVIGSRPQVRWYSRICLGVIWDNRSAFLLAVQAHDVLGVRIPLKYCVSVPIRFSTLPPSGHLTNHEINRLLDPLPSFYTVLPCLDVTPLVICLYYSFGRV